MTISAHSNDGYEPSSLLHHTCPSVPEVDSPACFSGNRTTPTWGTCSLTKDKNTPAVKIKHDAEKNTTISSYIRYA